MSVLIAANWSSNSTSKSLFCLKYKRKSLDSYWPLSAEIIASDVIKINFTAFKYGGSNAILATRGSDLTVAKSINSKDNCRLLFQPYFCNRNYQISIYFRNFLKQTHKAATLIGTWTDCKSIESCLSGKLGQCNKALDSFYSSLTTEFDVHNNN